jgi:hypothetical protein
MKSVFRPSTFLLVAALLALVFGVPQALAGEKRFRVTLEFSEPAYQCSEVVTYRQDFHFFMERSPFPDVPFVGGTIYPKDGVDYISIRLGTSKSDKREGVQLGGVKHLKLLDSLTFEIPPAANHFKKCTVTLTPLK